MSCTHHYQNVRSALLSPISGAAIITYSTYKEIKAKKSIVISIMMVNSYQVYYSFYKFKNQFKLGPFSEEKIQRSSGRLVIVNAFSG